MKSNPEITILLPGIRPSLWPGVYSSILKSTKRDFELIVCGPYFPPPELKNLSNVRFIHDWGSMLKSSQVAAQLARGKLLTWIADDSLLIEGALDKNIDLLYSLGQDINNVVVAKYYEGQNGTDKPLQPDEYFKVNGSSWTSSPFIPDYWIYNVAIMYRQFFEYLGGWDCETFSTCLGHTDLANRAQIAGAHTVMSEFPLLDCDHKPSTVQGSDHLPIEQVQTHVDLPRYKEKYNQPLENINSVIDFQNWRRAEQVWGARFKV